MSNQIWASETKLYPFVQTAKRVQSDDGTILSITGSPKDGDTLSVDGDKLLFSGGSTVHNTDWAGIWASPVNGPLNITKISDVVIINFESLIGVGAPPPNTATSTVSLNEEYRPLVNKVQPFIVIDNTVRKMSAIEIRTDGFIEVFGDVSGGNFVPGGLDGFVEQTVVYKKI